ncbi:glycosyltransferase [Rhizobium sp. BK376]|uniref:glycosyltransferase n=1 Tax=Rhizobium sp. BK376 TaxID=2512149 RepID=UPI001042B26E|nr:glycosyltransferase [Rhizobium sp. BK376]TCR71861.1 glycosyltransferase involved in cell wall biosynthesis [Rhizobium sp. BK376]
MRILTIVSIFFPHTFGGAEVSSLNSVRWLRDQGHVVSVVTACAAEEEELFGEVIDGITIYRMRFPRPHTLNKQSAANKIRKVQWQLQDHLDPRNKINMARALDHFKPDIVFARVVPGIGYNCFDEISSRDIPSIVFIHDFNMICARSDMYRDGKSCERLCMPCRVVGGFRQRKISSVKRLSLCAPSQYALDTVVQFSSHNFPSRKSIMNANKYPTPTVSRTSSNVLRILYVGRMHRTKGVDTLLKAVSTLHSKYDVHLTLLGEGPEEGIYRDQYGGFAWCSFKGKVTQQEVADSMVGSDVLCIPSEWRENSPGVVIHAITLGLPVIGSKTGGIPEYVKDGYNGLLYPPGDVEALVEALGKVISELGLLDRFRENAEKMSSRFQQDAIGQEIIDLAISTIKLQQPT